MNIIIIYLTSLRSLTSLVHFIFDRGRFGQRTISPAKKAYNCIIKIYGKKCNKIQLTEKNGPRQLKKINNHPPSPVTSLTSLSPHNMIKFLFSLQWNTIHKL